MPIRIEEALSVLSRGGMLDHDDDFRISWSNGFVEFDVMTEGCRAGDMIGLLTDRFTCATFLDRLFDLADRFGMMIIWDESYVTREQIAEHYVPDARENVSSAIIVKTSKEMIDDMKTIWTNCAPDAELVV